MSVTRLDGVIAALEGVDVVLCSKIGDCPKDSLKAAGIRATDDFAHDWIEAGIAAWLAAEFGQVTPAASDNVIQASA